MVVDVDAGASAEGCAEVDMEVGSEGAELSCGCDIVEALSCDLTEFRDVDVDEEV